MSNQKIENEINGLSDSNDLMLRLKATQNDDEITLIIRRIIELKHADFIKEISDFKTLTEAQLREILWSEDFAKKVKDQVTLELFKNATIKVLPGIKNQGFSFVDVDHKNITHFKNTYLYYVRESLIDAHRKAQIITAPPVAQDAGWFSSILAIVTGWANTVDSWISRIFPQEPVKAPKRKLTYQSFLPVKKFTDVRDSAMGDLEMFTHLDRAARCTRLELYEGDIDWISGEQVLFEKKYGVELDNEMVEYWRAYRTAPESIPEPSIIFNSNDKTAAQKNYQAMIANPKTFSIHYMEQAEKIIEHKIGTMAFSKILNSCSINKLEYLITEDRDVRAIESLTGPSASSLSQYFEGHAQQMVRDKQDPKHLHLTYKGGNKQPLGFDNPEKFLRAIKYFLIRRVAEIKAEQSAQRQQAQQQKQSQGLVSYLYSCFGASTQTASSVVTQTPSGQKTPHQSLTTV